MNDEYGISVRTMDLGSDPYQWVLATRPLGMKALRNSSYGYVAVVPKVSMIILPTIVAGMNTAGLSCDVQTLLGSKYPRRNKSLDNIDAGFICRWALEAYSTVEEIKAALPNFNFVKPLLSKDQHWVFRDVDGQSLILEFLDGEAQVTVDLNDGGATGFGIMTNEPKFSWHVEAVRHLEWKRGLARSSIAMPGSWYPDERFQRIHLVKSGMPKPATYQKAMMQAVHVLNTVTVPMGEQIGTDSGKGEGKGDHTQFGIVYDHKQGIVYWRTEVNQNLQRLRLSDASLQRGTKEQLLELQESTLPWFNDVAPMLSSSNTAITAIL